MVDGFDEVPEGVVGVGSGEVITVARDVQGAVAVVEKDTEVRAGFFDVREAGGGDGDLALEDFVAAEVVPLAAGVQAERLGRVSVGQGGRQVFAQVVCPGLVAEPVDGVAVIDAAVVVYRPARGAVLVEVAVLVDVEGAPVIG
jgi:hypothetical protein